MNAHIKKVACFIFLIIMAVAVIVFLQSKQYISVQSLMAHHDAFQQWAVLNKVKSLLLYSASFTLLIACGIPCASILTLLGGAVFGYMGILYAEVATALGGFILFLITKHTLGEYFAGLHHAWIKTLEKGFKKNAFNYLLMLRLMPILPCWVSNISAGVLNVPNKTFVLATLIGIFPATCIYGLAGNSLEKIIDNYGDVSLSGLILNPIIFFPLLGLALLSLTPILYKSIKNNSN